ncbi:DoxX family protein [Frondihabitans australicus]|uniref:Putative oxidoreductase n=1 Tax=Frondihabitans australicus TaxID=386892 RepID=A0A495IEH8_9MICO|nr:DoxX family protein [Frondihabitans australicus]RKR74397.1 putative oxidoreductase [Frondihabitans australicus]
MGLGTTLLRITVGGLFVGHGLQKLTGAFDGPGLAGVEGMMKSLDMHPARRNALLASATETFGGAALVLGAGTPLAAAGLIGSMSTAIRKVHGPKGVWNSGGGYEYNAVLIAALAALAAGPGKASFDAITGHKKWGVGGTLFALGVGFASSAAVIEYGRRSAPLESA